MTKVNDIVKKSDIYDNYNAMIQTIIDKIQINKESGIKFTLKAPLGTNGKISSYLIAPSAIPDGQLSNEVPPNINGRSLTSMIIASEVYNLLLSVFNLTTKIRKSTYYWYHKVNSNFVLEETLSDKTANYEEVTSEVTGSTTPYFVKTPNIRNMIADITTGTPNKGIEQNKNILLSNLNDILTELYTRWDTYKNDNPVDYKLYTCHFVCHSNYDDRARR